MALKHLLVPVLALACLQSPRKDYDDFLHRADRTAKDAGTGPMSRLENLTGTFFVNTLLAGGLNLALRMRLEMDPAAQPIVLRAHVTLASQPPDAPPLVSTEAMVAPDGTFSLTIDPLVLGPNELPVNTNVRASVVMTALTIDADSWCGSATGHVEEPLVLDLAGTTFLARRDDGFKLTAKDVAQRCPGTAAPPDAGAPSDAARPAPPDLSSVPSQLADVTGQWYLTAKLAGSIPLKLGASIVYMPAGPGSGGALDGSLRRASDPPGTPALVTFSTAVDASGRFEIWIPSLSLATMTGDPIQATILLEGATLGPDSFCGLGAGQVTSPLMLDLAGTTFAAVRWTPGMPPMNAPDRCP